MLALTDQRLRHMQAAAALLRPEARDAFLHAIAHHLQATEPSDSAVLAAIHAALNAAPLAHIDGDAVLAAAAHAQSGG